jgi:hypothetical protein
MKQLFTLLLLTAGLFARSTPTKPEPAALQAFEATYGKQTPAAWTCTAAGCQVQFELKGQTITAVYTPTGKLRWYKKHIYSTELPVFLQMSIKKHLAGYWISDVVEQSGKEGTTYTVTLENASGKAIMTAKGNQWRAAKAVAKV